ncbi:hypothetical protein J6590_105528, partial [Homalodisca vitripennis]
MTLQTSNKDISVATGGEQLCLNAVVADPTADILILEISSSQQHISYSEAIARGSRTAYMTPGRSSTPVFLHGLLPHHQRLLREPNEDDSDVDLSGESEVFDYDRDPEYHPSVDSDYSDTRKPRFSRLFEKRFERQGDQDNVAGPSITAREDVSSEDSEYEKLLKKKNYRKRKKAVKGATEKKKISSKKKVTENETEQDKDETDKTGDTSEEENKEEENYQESQTEGKGKNKENKSKRTAREHEYKLTVFGTERDIKWEDWQGRQKPFAFTGRAGINPE